MDHAAATKPLVEEFVAAYERRGKKLPVEPSVCGGFADLCWEPYPHHPFEEMERFEREEPAFVFRTDRHQLAFHRVYGEIRYFAGPGPCVGTLFTPTELGMFDSVEDAAKFATLFLNGVELDEIDVPRRAPEWAIESRRRHAALWPPIDPATWQSIPCLTGRVATADDLEERRALFVLNYTGPDGPSVGLSRYSQHGVTINEPGDEPGTTTSIDIPLPRCALLHEASDERYPAIAVQAERSPSSARVGLRFIRGGWIVRPLEKVEFLDNPTQEFFDEYARALERAARRAARRGDAA
ncbi:MAG TPA: hypothetical protein VFS20_17635 [Longimicrobium sp.]|nr:hypothetical protein [Longimicrobium sp.]